VGGGGIKGITKKKDQEKQNDEDEEDLKTPYKKLASSDQRMKGQYWKPKCELLCLRLRARRRESRIRRRSARTRVESKSEDSAREGFRTT